MRALSRSPHRLNLLHTTNTTPTQLPLATNMPPVATTTATVTETPAAPAKQSTANLDSEAINRVWRGNKEGTIKLDGYPDCWNATDEQGLLAKRQYVKVSPDVTTPPSLLTTYHRSILPSSSATGALRASTRAQPATLQCATRSSGTITG